MEMKKNKDITVKTRKRVGAGWPMVYAKKKPKHPSFLHRIQHCHEGGTLVTPFAHKRGGRPDM